MKIEKKNCCPPPADSRVESCLPSEEEPPTPDMDGVVALQFFKKEGSKYEQRRTWDFQSSRGRFILGPLRSVVGNTEGKRTRAAGPLRSNSVHESPRKHCPQFGTRQRLSPPILAQGTLGPKYDRVFSSCGVKGPPSVLRGGQFYDATGFSESSGAPHSRET